MNTSSVQLDFVLDMGCYASSKDKEHTRTLGMDYPHATWWDQIVPGAVGHADPVEVSV